VDPSRPFVIFRIANFSSLNELARGMLYRRARRRQAAAVPLSFSSHTEIDCAHAEVSRAAP
jgi:hypothetical protein